jgi:hypothetical protein
MPKIQAQEILPGEKLSTFDDIILQEILKDDDTLAAFKFTRFNNYKRGLYNTLNEYDNSEYL